MILHLHNRYRTTGGEERAVEDLIWLTREHMGEDAELLARGSSGLGRPRAAVGLLAGGLRPQEVARAVRRSRARIVHAHNLNPTFGWRALAAAREAGARVVLHLHQYRIVCAVGVCFTHGEDCTRCHGRNTLPGVVHNCRGSVTEAVLYAAGLAAWQPRLAAHADVVIAPSRFAVERLGVLGAPVRDVHVVPPVVREFSSAAGAATAGRAPGADYALVASRLAPEKGVEVAIEACRLAGIPLVVAGEGPEASRLRDTGDGVRFVGHVSRRELARLRADAALALMPSHSGETFGLAAAEAMAAGLPVVASRVGALPELVPAQWLVRAGDAAELAGAILRVLREPGTRERAIAAARALVAPESVAPRLASVYGMACQLH